MSDFQFAVWCFAGLFLASWIIYEVVFGGDAASDDRVGEAWLREHERDAGTKGTDGVTWNWDELRNRKDDR